MAWGLRGPGGGLAAWGLAAWGPAAGGWSGWGGRERGVDLEQVGDGVLEGPFAGGPGLAAHGEAAESAVVLDVAEGCFGDRCAVPVGGDSAGGGQPGGHLGGRVRL